MEIIENAIVPKINYVGKPPHKPASKERLKALENKEKFYIPINPCKRGHLTKRLSKNGNCVECNNFMKKKNLHKYRLQQVYKLTVEQYNEILKFQNGVCAICKKEEIHTSFGEKIKRLAVDHCHKTGKIRGLLCYQCNISIGNLKHNPKILRQAALYCEAI